MRKYIFIAIGGMLGAILRYFIKNIHIYNYKEAIPINTLLINVSGSFLLALILTIAFEIFEFDADLRLGIATGFLGAYTTFSTLCKETVNLMNARRLLLFYILYRIFNNFWACCRLLWGGTSKRSSFKVCTS